MDLQITNEVLGNTVSELSEKKGSLPSLDELPVDRGEWTKKHKEKAEKIVDHFSKMPLRELRKRQDMTRAQRQLLNRQVSSSYGGWDNASERQKKASRNLFLMDYILMWAVDKREFGPKKKSKKKASRKKRVKT